MRDFSTISPSARWLLLAKANSGLPFAREAAELVFGADEVAAAATPPSPFEAMRRRHFEARARSVDEAFDAVGARSLIELAAGYSLRGLARSARGDDYLDTDLPAVVDLKAELAEQLAPDTLAGRYRMMPLDALDGDTFAAAADSMEPGPLAIAHEGLLMYLDGDEKARLAANVRAALVARGGAWISADVYLRMNVPAQRTPEVEKFLADHRVEENKFATWDAATSWFERAGFTVDQRLTPPDPVMIRQTWILRPR